MALGGMLGLGLSYDGHGRRENNEPQIAVDILLYDTPKNAFLANGCSTGGPYPYFPSNGGLLYAAAMMAAGWDGCPHRNAPGFPNNGDWIVRWENMNPAP